ncbi:MAG: glycosyltransferase family 39 protein [Planctomycetota bacterium]
MSESERPESEQSDESGQPNPSPAPPEDRRVVPNAPSLRGEHGQQAPKPKVEIVVGATDEDETPRPVGTESLPPAPRRGILVAALVIYGVTSFWTGLNRALWQGEVDTAMVVRDLGKEGNSLIVPSLAGRARIETPPLYEWIAAPLAMLPGVSDEAALRLPSVFFALLSLWLTYLLGARIFDHRIGLLALSLQATTGLFYFHSSWAGPELPFAACIQLALTAYAFRVEKNDLRWGLVFWVALGLGAMFSSLFSILVYVCVPIVASEFFRGGVDRIRETRRSLKRGWPLLWILCLPWYVYVATTSDASAADAWSVVHFGDPNRVMERPSITSTLFFGFLPWTLLLPLGIFHGKDRTSRPGERLCIFWIVWSFLVAILFPLAPGANLLQLWAPFCLLVPAALYEHRERFSVWETLLRDWLLRLLPWLLRAPLALIVVAAGLWLAGLYESWVDPGLAVTLSDAGSVGPAAGLLFVAGCGAFYVAAKVTELLKREERATAVFESTRAMLFLLFALGFSLPILDRRESPKFFVERLPSVVESAPLATYGVRAPAELEYYLEREEPFPHFAYLDPKKETEKYAPQMALEAYLRREDRVFLLLSKTELAQLKFQFPGVHTALHDTGVEGRLGQRGEYVLKTNRAMAVAPPKTPQNAPGKSPSGTSPSGKSPSGTDG